VIELLMSAINSAMIGVVIKVYQRLYEDGIVIVTDFFDNVEKQDAARPHYPTQLFTCTDAQAKFITKSRVSRDTVFDGIVRSQETCSYKTHIEVQQDRNKSVKGPAPRQQLKHNEV
jgi:hypothetical protein